VEVVVARSNIQIAHPKKGLGRVFCFRGEHVTAQASVVLEALLQEARIVFASRIRSINGKKCKGRKDSGNSSSFFRLTVVGEAEVNMFSTKA
jgi:hypothetical protein